MDNRNLPKKEDCPKYCIFEKRICVHADKNGNTFQCKASSDDAMTCNK